MTRRRRSEPGSLELLLDTICNTFGGVLFIALLIAVLVQLTSDAAVRQERDAPSAETMRELQQVSKQLQFELETLASAAEQQLEQAAEYADAEVQAFLESVKQERVAVRNRMKQRLELVDSIAAHRVEVAEIAERREELGAELDKAEKQLEQVREDVEQEKANRTDSGELSRLQTSQKREVGLIVRYGRMYVWHRYDETGSRRLGVNTDDLVVVEERSEGIICRPNPAAGIALEEGEAAHSRMQKRLAKFRPERDKLAIVVWPESYGDFRHLRATVVKLGFQYRLMPMDNDGMAVDQGGSDNTAQ